VRLGHETVYGITITAGTKGSKGIPGEVKSPQLPITGCSFQPLTTTEQTGDMDLTQTMWRLLAPPSPQAMTLTATSQVMAYGTTYQVFGDPQVQPDRRGKPDHLVILLRKATG